MNSTLHYRCSSGFVLRSLSGSIRVHSRLAPYPWTSVEMSRSTANRWMVMKKR
jgi:uncharacterized protein YqhQ